MLRHHVVSGFAARVVAGVTFLLLLSNDLPGMVKNCYFRPHYGTEQPQDVFGIACCSNSPARHLSEL